MGQQKEDKKQPCPPHFWQLTPEDGRFLGKCRKCQSVKYFPDWNRLKFSEQQELTRKAKGESA